MSVESSLPHALKQKEHALKTKKKMRRDVGWEQKDYIELIEENTKNREFSSSYLEEMGLNEGRLRRKMSKPENI